MCRHTATKLVQIQASSIARNLPKIVKKIDEKLNSNMAELKKLPKHVSNAAEATTTFMQIIGLVKESLRKILLRGEFDEYPENNGMHCTARLVEIFNEFCAQLHSCAESDPAMDFLMDEIKILEESKEVWLPNFLPRTAFLSILQKRVKRISGTPVKFVHKLWDYIEEVVLVVLMDHVEDYHQLQFATKRACQNLIAKMKERSINWVMEIVEMETVTDYTCNPDYLAEWTKLMAERDNFKRYLFVDELRPSTIKIDGLGEVEVGVLRQYSSLIDQAFDLRMRIVAYWKIVLQRIVDCMVLHLRLSVKNLVHKELEMEIVNESLALHVGGIEMLMEESPSVASKRAKLNRSIKKLKDCKAVVAKIMDRTVSHGD